MIRPLVKALNKERCSARADLIEFWINHLRLLLHSFTLLFIKRLIIVPRLDFLKIFKNIFIKKLNIINNYYIIDDIR